jgi:hypothetical protein
MGKAEEESPREVVFLPRNFTLTPEERMRALVAGPPAFAVRLRRIEDLEAAIVRSLVEHEAKTGAPLDAAALPFTVRREIDRLIRLVDDHNRYYPIEARLPTDVRTGQLMDWGEPWVPRPPPSADALIAAARALSAREGGRCFRTRG